MRRKFDICYMMAKEGVPFEKYAALHELEVRPTFRRNTVGRVASHDLYQKVI